MSSAQLRESSLVSELVWGLAEGDPEAPISPHTFEALRAAVGADFVSYYAFGSSPKERRIWKVGELPVVHAEVQRALAELRSEDPLWRRATTPGVVMAFSDFMTRREYRNSRLWADVGRPLEVAHMVALWFPAAMGEVRGLMCASRGRDFGVRTRDLLALLYPYLRRADDRFLARQSVICGGARFLTRREREVLALVAEGRTNAEIARVLVVSRSTVRQHLENTFEKLGVHTRGAAVARLLAANPPRALHRSGASERPRGGGDQDAPPPSRSLPA